MTGRTFQLFWDCPTYLLSVSYPRVSLESRTAYSHCSKCQVFCSQLQAIASSRHQCTKDILYFANEVYDEEAHMNNANDEETEVEFELNALIGNPRLSFTKRGID